MYSDKDHILEDGGEKPTAMHKTSAYFRTVVSLHNLRDRAKESIDSWQERGLRERLHDGWSNTRRTVTTKTRSFFTHSDNVPCSHIPEKYGYVFRPKSRWELIRLSGTVCGIEFCYAAETAFVTPILLSLGLSIKFVTMIWCLSPLIGLFLTPILGSMSDSCNSKFGRRRPFILMYSIGILLGLILVPNGHHIGLALGDQQQVVVNENDVTILNGSFISEMDQSPNLAALFKSVQNPLSTQIPNKDTYSKLTLRDTGVKLRTNLKDALQRNKDPPRELDETDIFPDKRNGRLGLILSSDLENELEDPQDEFSRLVDTEDIKQKYNYLDKGSENSKEELRNVNTTLTRQNDEEDLYENFHNSLIDEQLNENLENSLEDEIMDNEELDAQDMRDDTDYELDFKDYSKLKYAERTTLNPKHSIVAQKYNQNTFLNSPNNNVKFYQDNKQHNEELDGNDVFPQKVEKYNMAPFIRNNKLGKNLNADLKPEAQKVKSEPYRNIDDEDIFPNNKLIKASESLRTGTMGNLRENLIKLSRDSDDTYPNLKYNPKKKRSISNPKPRRYKRSNEAQEENAPFRPLKILPSPISDVVTNHIQPWSIAFTVMGTVLLDFCSDACQSPSRTYLLDVSIPSDHAAGLSTFTVMAGLGGSIGYAMGALHWESTYLGRLLGGQVNVVFMIVTIIFLICLITTVCSFPEIPLSIFKDPKMFKEYQEKFQSETNQDNASEMAILDNKPKRYGSTDETNGVNKIIKEDSEVTEETAVAQNETAQTEMGIITEKLTNEDLYEVIPDAPNSTEANASQAKTVEINIVEELGSSNEHPTLKEYLKSILRMPNSLRILCLTNLFCWMSLVCYSLYFTDFVGECVFGGDPQAPDGSHLKTLYQEGVQFGCWGMALYSISCSIYSLFIEALVKKIGAKSAYVGGQLVYSIGMVIMAISRHKVAVILLSPTAGVMYSTLFTMPYLLIAHYHSTKQFSKNKNASEIIIRGIGTDVAAVSSMVFLSQFVLSLTMGSIVVAIGSNVVPICAAAVLSACGAVSATQVLYLDI